MIKETFVIFISKPEEENKSRSMSQLVQKEEEAVEGALILLS